MQLDLGQPLRTIVQFAYVVPDLERAMSTFGKALGIGPWFVRGPFQPPEGRHRGQPATFTVTLARAFAGHAMVELIEQADDGPSVFHEGDGPRGYGFHHWAMVTDTFDDDVARYLALGYEEAFFDRLPSGSRVVYLDSTHDLPGMLELVEYSAEQERAYTRMWQASLGWDGREPIRREA